jgi:glycogen debranching enzyme
VIDAWANSAGPPIGAGTAGGTTLVRGSTFCICDSSGDVHTGTAQGLYYRDSRLLSRFTLRLDKHSPEPLTAQSEDPFSCTFVGRRRPRPGSADSTLLVVRERHLGAGVRDRISLRNLGEDAAAFTMSLHVEADFADLFEVKENRTRPREAVALSVLEGALQFTATEGTHTQGVRVSSADAEAHAPGVLRWHVVVPGRSTWTTCVRVTPVVDGVPLESEAGCRDLAEEATPAAWFARWRRAARVRTPDPSVRRLFETSVEDLGALRIFDPDYPERAMVAAGAPWFMTLFGRDSLLTASMLLPVDPSLAVGTLETLARLQGTEVHEQTEEEPGRILHEVRFGPSMHSAFAGRNVYYGSVDATPLFVMLLGQVRLWGAGLEEVAALLPHADAALRWIEEYGDRDGDGFVEYQRATDSGLLNQGWKDSHDGVTFADGRLATGPIALAEVQGYVYSAYRARARLARELGDRSGDEHWSNRAAAVKRAFNERFWLPDAGYYALGLDGEKRVIDALASNMGHCLWTGIVDDDKAARVADALLSPEMFTGFGVRTLASSMGAYNPMSYHNGSVWPHDNAIVAAGLARYGFVRHAQRVIQGQFDAARHLGGRMPEVFCGFDTDDFSRPVPYPTACSPQAWAAASPLLMLRTLLGLDADIPSGRLWFAPAVPKRLQPLRVEGLYLAGQEITVEVTARRSTIEGVPDWVDRSGDPRPSAYDLP